MPSGKFKSKFIRHWGKFSLLVLLLLIIGLWLSAIDAERRYKNLISVVVYDRNQTPISIKENSKGHYVHEFISLPPNFEKLLIKKEDKYFLHHPGINPVSTIRAAIQYAKGGKAGGSSTITQQLAKNLLKTESDRTLKNKLTESFYAFGIELFNSKKTIINMYVNTAYFGNQIQGFDTASRAYFDKPLSETTHNEQISLLATLSHPSARNPWEKDNIDYALFLNERISPDEVFAAPVTTKEYSLQKDSYFELRTSGVYCENTCQTTIDEKISKNIRTILDRHIKSGWSRNIKNGAVVVIDAKNSELLSLVGSRNPNSQLDGDQINMAIEPRPIGSTIKPFIYAKGFTDGLRPYSIVDDREYKYPIATGYSLYPKNYDGLYRGEITLHEALSNSLNVPSVKILEYIGLENFYLLLDESLKFSPIQNYDSYQYGIALGGLEMDLLTLTHYFTVFPQKGSLSPLTVLKSSDNNFNLPPQSNITQTVDVFDEEYVELVHAIISDRFTGVNQFGVANNLNLSISDYGVKTGTSRDFHDSWVVGYTPDFVVGVWLGNSQNLPLEQVSGQSGAGAVWHDVMEYLLATPYNNGGSIDIKHLERYTIDSNEEWGLRGDIITDHRNLLQEDNLILSLHEGDEFELTNNTIIPLKSRKPVLWSINENELEYAKETTFNPTKAGTYEVFALDESTGVRESLLIHLTIPQ